MREIFVYQAIREAIAEEMRRDSRVYLIGEAVGPFGTSVVRSPKELVEEFGEKRVRETGIIEQFLAGGSHGAALAGMRPIVDFLQSDFMYPAWSELVDAGLWRSGQGATENMSVPVVYMSGIMSYSAGGYSHARAPIGTVMHAIGLKLVLPTTPYDTKGLLKTAVRDDNPVVFMSHRLQYRSKGPVPEEEYLIPFGVATIRREGKDCTIVAVSYCVDLALQAAEELAKEGITVEVIDPRTLEPLDIDTIVTSVKKTGRLVVADEDYMRCGVGAEIGFQVQEKAFKSLKAPVERVGNLNTPVPVAPVLLNAVMPTKEKIMAAVKKTLK